MSGTILWCGLLILVGILMVLCGAGFVVMYVLEAVVARIGAPDQSLLFWYLPILFMGLIAMGTGLGAIVWGSARLREKSRRNRSLDSEKSPSTRRPDQP